MTDSRSGSTPDAPTGDVCEFAPPSNTYEEAAVDPGSGGPGRARKRAALTLGGTAVLAVAGGTALAVVLSGGGTTRIVIAADSPSGSAPLSHPGYVVTVTPHSGRLVTVTASPQASKRKAAPAHPSSAATAAPAHPSPAAVADTVPAVSAPTMEAPATASKVQASGNSAGSGGSAGASTAQPVGWWTLFDDDAAETAQDSAGRDVATGTNVGWCAPAGGHGVCATFNGKSSAFATSQAVVDTASGSSFTVAANVDMTALAAGGAPETIVSQDGTHVSGFYLQYSGFNLRWAFGRTVSDTAGEPATIRALSTSTPELSTWTHLVGVYDASDNQLRLYVNGLLEGTATDSTPFAATGDLAIGRALFNGQQTDWFNGAANQVRVYNQALTATQVAQISQL